MIAFANVFQIHKQATEQNYMKTLRFPSACNEFFYRGKGLLSRWYPDTLYFRNITVTKTQNNLNIFVIIS
jgi:hypothetical protein